MQEKIKQVEDQAAAIQAEACQVAECGEHLKAELVNTAMEGDDRLAEPRSAGQNAFNTAPVHNVDKQMQVEVTKAEQNYAMVTAKAQSMEQLADEACGIEKTILQENARAKSKAPAARAADDKAATGSNKSTKKQSRPEPWQNKWRQKIILQQNEQ